jgi:hypothetical protein
MQSAQRGTGDVHFVHLDILGGTFGILAVSAADLLQMSSGVACVMRSRCSRAGLGGKVWGWWGMGALSKTGMGEVRYQG